VVVILRIESFRDQDDTIAVKHLPGSVISFNKYTIHEQQKKMEESLLVFQGCL
jgi:hypothetical protein